MGHSSGITEDNMFTIERITNDYVRYNNSFGSMAETISYILYMCSGGDKYNIYCNGTPICQFAKYNDNDFSISFFDVTGGTGYPVAN